MVLSGEPGAVSETGKEVSVPAARDFRGTQQCIAEDGGKQSGHRV